MQRLMRELRDQRERGASAIVVAITLMVMLGFAGFGIDVTSAYAKSQEVQNAADAAALAAAQYCAEADPACVPGDREDASTELASSNILHQAYSVEAFDTYPRDNWVTVEVRADHENVFAGLFGFQSFEVVRQATAVWETPVGGPATLPLTVSACSFYTQAGEPVLGQQIYLWLSKGQSTFVNDEDDDDVCGENYPPGGFGWLPADSECETDVQMPGYIVVSDTGADRPGCVDAALLTIGDVFLIPIFDDYETVGTGNGGRYGLQRFAALKLEAYRFQEGGPNMFDGVPQPACPDSTKPDPSSEYRKSCLRVMFVEWVELGDDYEGDEDEESELSVIRLIDPAFEGS